ncbi:MAG: MOSC domain-containing protein [Chloroflexota bacterium]
MQVERPQSKREARVISTGKIISIAYSPKMINNVGKEPKTGAEITMFGIEGDRHFGETRYSPRQHKRVPNLRPVTVMAVEGVREACDALGIPADTVPFGGMGENILTDGLGNLGDASEGDLIRVLDEQGEPKVILQVGGQNNPCSNLQFYHKQMTKQMMHKRGVFCSVLKAGHIEIGDTVTYVKV